MPNLLWPSIHIEIDSHWENWPFANKYQQLGQSWTPKYFAASRSNFVYIETDLSSCEQRSRSLSMLSISGRSVFCSWYIRTNALSEKYPNRACYRFQPNISGNSSQKCTAGTLYCNHVLFSYIYIICIIRMYTSYTYTWYVYVGMVHTYYHVCTIPTGTVWTTFIGQALWQVSVMRRVIEIYDISSTNDVK